jgi:hypothetical protein
MPSRATNARIAALATTLAAGVLAAFALRPSVSGTGSAAHVQQQAAEVRTQVIRRTVHIVRHERPPRGRVTPRGSVGGQAAIITTGGTSHVPRTGTSGSHPTAAGVPTGVSTPRTRTSGSSTGAVGTGTTPTTGSAGAPVRTRTSGTPAAGTPSRSGSSAPVRTRTSGGATSGGGSGGSGAVRTRPSGGDGGGGHDD